MAFGPDPFTLTVERTDAALIAHAAGEIDLAAAAETSAELLAATARLPPPHLVVLDLTAVSFFNAAAAHAVRDFAAICADRGISTRLVADAESIAARVIALACLDATLPTYRTVEQAL